MTFIETYCRLRARMKAHVVGYNRNTIYSAFGSIMENPRKADQIVHADVPDCIEALKLARQGERRVRRNKHWSYSESADIFFRAALIAERRKLKRAHNGTSEVQILAADRSW